MSIHPLTPGRRFGLSVLALVIFFGSAQAFRLLPYFPGAFGSIPLLGGIFGMCFALYVSQTSVRKP